MLFDFFLSHRQTLGIKIKVAKIPKIKISAVGVHCNLWLRVGHFKLGFCISVNFHNFKMSVKLKMFIHQNLLE